MNEGSTVYIYPLFIRWQKWRVEEWGPEPHVSALPGSPRCSPAALRHSTPALGLCLGKEPHGGIPHIQEEQRSGASALPSTVSV